MDPILRDRNGLSGAGAGCIELGVGTARSDELGKLRVTHGENAEQETPVKDIGFLIERGAQVGNLPLDLLAQ